jgi:hypothetical protein
MAFSTYCYGDFQPFGAYGALQAFHGQTGSHGGTNEKKRSLGQ